MTCPASREEALELARRARGAPAFSHGEASLARRGPGTLLYRYMLFYPAYRGVAEARGVIGCLRGRWVAPPPSVKAHRPEAGDVVFLEGVSAVGKSTVAPLVAGMLGAEPVELEARQCWPLPPGGERQRCFLRSFAGVVLRSMLLYRRVVYSNGLVTLAAYSRASGEEWAAREALLALRLLETAARVHVVVLDAEPRELKARAAARAALETGRALDRAWERGGRLHEEAREELLRLARERGVPVVDTTGVPPGRVAEKALEELGSRLRARV